MNMETSKSSQYILPNGLILEKVKFLIYSDISGQFVLSTK